MRYRIYTPAEHECLCGKANACSFQIEKEKCSIRNCEEPVLIIDMSGKSLLNSTFAGQILHSTTKRNKRVVLLNASHKVKTILQMLGIDKMISYYKNLDEALWDLSMQEKK